MSEGFLSRWAQRKALANQPAEMPTPAPIEHVESPCVAESLLPNELADPNEIIEVTAPADPLPDPLPGPEDLRDLTPASDFTKFMRFGVDPSTRNAALKTLFTDPHYQIMDMMDIYVDDYSKPDPIPLEMLKNLQQSFDLKLFEQEDGEKVVLEQKDVDPLAVDDKQVHGQELTEQALASPALATKAINNSDDLNVQEPPNAH